MAKKPTLTPEEARQEALKTALETIERKFGQGAVMKLSDNVHVKVPVIPTGSIGLDLALGIGGIPRGRVTEIYGPESSGKTTLTLHIIAECQKRGGTAAFIDAEHALDITYANRLGVKTDELLISQPDHGEQALEIADMLVRSGAVDLVVIDSVAALIPQAELEGAMGETQVGGHARLMSQALRKLTGAINKTNCVVIFINQLREKVGVMYGNPEVTTGGRALKFYASVRMEVRRVEAIKNGTSTTPFPEQYRVMFEGIPCWPKLPNLFKPLKEHGVNVTAVVYAPAFGFVYNNMDEMVRAYYKAPNSVCIEQGVSWREGICKDNKVDGVLVHYNRSCKPWSGYMAEMQRRFTEDLGIPCAGFDGDQADPRNFNEAQYETRVQGLVEAMEAKKAKEGNA